MHKASLFDLDKTLLKGNSSFLFGVYLYQRRYFSPFKMIHLLSTYGCYRVGLLSIRSLHERVFHSLFHGRCRKELLRLADDFLDLRLQELLYLPALSRLQEALKRGDYTAICSSGPSFLVEKIANRLGVDEWMATGYGTDKEMRYDALLEIVEGEEKAVYAKELAERLGLVPENMTAYSDSRHDLPFLEAAGNKVGVNPDRILKRLCRQNQWEML